MHHSQIFPTQIVALQSLDVRQQLSPDGDVHVPWSSQTTIQPQQLAPKNALLDPKALSFTRTAAPFPHLVQVGTSLWIVRRRCFGESPRPKLQPSELSTVWKSVPQQRFGQLDSWTWKNKPRMEGRTIIDVDFCFMIFSMFFSCNLSASMADKVLKKTRCTEPMSILSSMDNCKDKPPGSDSSQGTSCQVAMIQFKFSVLRIFEFHILPSLGWLYLPSFAFSGVKHFAPQSKGCHNHCHGRPNGTGPKEIFQEDLQPSSLVSHLSHGTAVKFDECTQEMMNCSLVSHLFLRLHFQTPTV